MTNNDRNTLRTWISDFEFHETNSGNGATVEITIGTDRPDVDLADEVDTDAFCSHDAKWLVEKLVAVFADLFTIESDDLQWGYGENSYGGRTIKVSASVHLADGGNDGNGD